jgi:hypothetical protein
MRILCIFQLYIMYISVRIMSMLKLHNMHISVSILCMCRYVQYIRFNTQYVCYLDTRHNSE